MSASELSKGALYHHFSNKEELLFAVIEEVYQEQFLSRWRQVLLADNPLSAMAEVLECGASEVTEEMICTGCPVYNIAGELSAINDGLRARVDAIFRELCETIKKAFELAKQKGQVETSVDTERVSLLILSSLNGMPQIVKSCLDLSMYKQLNAALADYIRSFIK